MRTHGKYSTYNTGCRCVDCAEANRRRVRKQRTACKARLAVDPAIRHGERNTYDTYGCRCEPCRAAKSATNRAYGRRVAYARWGAGAS